MTTNILKHAGLCTLSTMLLISLLVSCGTPESRGENSLRSEGPLRGLIRERIQKRIQENRQNIAEPSTNTAIGDEHWLKNKRSYVLYVPNTYTKEKRVPLVVGLHGGYTTPKRFADTTKFNELAEKEGFLVAYPVGIDKHWNDGREEDSKTASNPDDVAFISAMIDDIQKNYNIDHQRIYATGMSNGGFMAQRLACALSNRIAAFASVAATMAKPLKPRCAPNQAVPMLMINGTADTLVPPQGGMMPHGKGGEILSVDETIQFWCTVNKCKRKPALAQKIDNKDGIPIQFYEYRGLRQRSLVVRVEIQGGGHTWPIGDGQQEGEQPKKLLGKVSERVLGKTSHNLDATQYIWDFFKKHTLS